MPGKRLSRRQKDRYINLRRRGMRQFEARELVRISRQSAHRLDESEGLGEVVASAPLLPPPKPVDLPTREMPMETALKLLQTLQHVTNPEGIQAVVNAVRDVIPAEILSDELKAVESPGLFPTGADGVSDLPHKTPEPHDDPDGDRYGNLVPDPRMRPRTWSPHDRRIDPGEGFRAEIRPSDIRPGSQAWERRAQAIRAARKRPLVSGGLRFYQP